MKQAKATVEEAETLLRWLQGQDTVDRQPPPYNRTIFGYLLMLEHCADPAKDYIDFKPGTSPDEIEALKQRAEAAEARVRELDKPIGHISLACGFPIVSDLGQATDTICKRITRVDAKVAELERELADLRNAGGPPFIRSEAIRKLKADLDAERASAGRVHGQIGLLANAAFGISDNLDTDTTLQAIEAGINDLKGRITQDHGIVALLEAQNARLRETLGDEYQRVAPVIADYPVQPWEHLGEGKMLGTWAEDGSPYHFAIPFQLVPAFQAMQRLASLTKRPALADGKAAPS